jgi:hypothetical protein
MNRDMRRVVAASLSAGNHRVAIEQHSHADRLWPGTGRQVRRFDRSSDTAAFLTCRLSTAEEKKHPTD